MAEWLRRLTRNQFPSGSAGSNPADCENFSFDFPTIVTRKLGHSLGHDRNSPFNPRAVGGKKTFGDGGYRSPYLSHAKRALYHLSYVPVSVIQEQILLGVSSCVKVKLQVAFCCQGHCQPIRVTHVLCYLPLIQPSIAQLVERWTVVVLCQISIGRWFKSGLKDWFLFCANIQ